MAETLRLASVRARKDRARDFLRWRKEAGGAVLLDPGGAETKKRKRERLRAPAADLRPVDKQFEDA